MSNNSDSVSVSVSESNAFQSQQDHPVLEETTLVGSTFVVKFKYSRTDMEALRFVNLDNQRKLWNSIFKTLQSRHIDKAYHSLHATPHHHNKKSPPSILDSVSVSVSENNAFQSQQDHPVLDEPALVGSAFVDPSSFVVKYKYSRTEMKALRFVNLDHQRKLWKSIFEALQSRHIDKDCHALLATPPHHNVNKKSPPSILGAPCNVNIDSELQLTKSRENVSLDDSSCTHSLMDGDGYSNLEESSEKDDSDDDYSSIQRPAFCVKGEPNFDAGAPEDGWEYLRRVRWEANRIPKVKVAKLDRSKLKKEQSAYMPKIPDIPQCPEHLLPLKQWEDVFLAEFSALRANLSSLEGSNNLQHVHSPKLLGKQLAGVMNMDVLLHHLSMDQPANLTAEDKDIALPPEKPASKTSVNKTNSGSPALPLLSAILGMDSVARVSMLLKRVSLLESEDTITRNDCMWIFALCAAVDVPLHADTSAALRGLLRKCASIRATKAELDEEVVMLNILATICGRYFGQSEN